MSVAKCCMVLSLILAGLSLLLQMISFVIPGWFISKTDDFGLNMALWYMYYCRHEGNITEIDTPCIVLAYHQALPTHRSQMVSVLGSSFTSMIGTQVQVTSCLFLTGSAFLLILFQLRTFLQQKTGHPTIYDNEPRGTCNLRSKFIYSGGFAAIFQIFSGILLGLVILDFGKRYFSLGKPRPPEPYALFIAGFGLVAGGLSGFFELIIAFRTKENPPYPREGVNGKHMTSQQLLPLRQGQGQSSGQGHSSAQGHNGNDRDNIHRDSPARTSIDDVDYYGQDYNVENPTFCTQGARKSAQSNTLFPGYRLGRHNLQGHNKKWWRKVAFASFPYW